MYGERLCFQQEPDTRCSLLWCLSKTLQKFQAKPDWVLFGVQQLNLGSLTDEISTLGDPNRQDGSVVTIGPL